MFGPSAWLMKSPPEQYHDDVAHRLAEAFIAKPVGRPGKTSAKRQVAATAPKAKAARTHGNGSNAGTGAAALSARTIAAPVAPRAAAGGTGRVTVRSRSRAAKS